MVTTVVGATVKGLSVYILQGAGVSRGIAETPENGGGGDTIHTGLHNSPQGGAAVGGERASFDEVAGSLS